MTTRPGLLDPRSFEIARERAARYFERHPGSAESLIPVWGSGREAIADLHDGDYLGAGINAVAAASDLFPAKAAGTAAAKIVARGGKVALKQFGDKSVESVAKALAGEAARWAKPTKHSKSFYDRTKKMMREYEFSNREQELHHWLFPQGGWGKRVPDVIKHNPLNLNPKKPTPHKRITRDVPEEGLKQYSPAMGAFVGTPTWAKGVIVGAPTHVGGAAKRKTDELPMITPMPPLTAQAVIFEPPNGYFDEHLSLWDEDYDESYSRLDYSSDPFVIVNLDGAAWRVREVYGEPRRAKTWGGRLFDALTGGGKFRPLEAREVTPLQLSLDEIKAEIYRRIPVAPLEIFNDDVLAEGRASRRTASLLGKS